MLEVYKPVWDALKNDDTKALETIFGPRCKEYDQAFYTEEGQNLYELIVYLKSLINDEGLALREMPLDTVDVCVSFNLKMIWLHNWDLSLSSTLSFEFKNADLETRIPIFFSKFDGKWEVVR